MSKTLLLSVYACLFSFFSFSQEDNNKTVLKGKEADEFMSKIGIDSTFFLKQSANAACKCIDSVDAVVKDKKKKIEAFSACIDDQVSPYQLMSQLINSNKNSTKKDVIVIAEKGSPGYDLNYFQIERQLMDSCTTLKRAISSNDEAKEKSYSTDPKALEEYDKGVELLKKEKYADCIPFFEKAVSIDPEFAFAWDNLGICYRRTNNLEKAEAAYKSSLKVDPTGKTALQNLAVVYQMQKRDDDAINAYKEILKYYPNDPEVYYGIGLVYYNNKKDWENALESMCKAYNIYIEQKSPYRSDAEQVINMIYGQMKKENKEEKFLKILKDNNIKTN